jgi:hypothetical protein
MTAWNELKITIKVFQSVGTPEYGFGYLEVNRPKFMKKNEVI